MSAPFELPRETIMDINNDDRKDVQPYPDQPYPVQVRPERLGEGTPVSQRGRGGPVGG